MRRVFESVLFIKHSHPLACVRILLEYSQAKLRFAPFAAARRRDRIARSLFLRAFKWDGTKCTQAHTHHHTKNPLPTRSCARTHKSAIYAIHIHANISVFSMPVRLRMPKCYRPCANTLRASESFWFFSLCGMRRRALNVSVHCLPTIRAAPASARARTDMRTCTHQHTHAIMLNSSGGPGSDGSSTLLCVVVRPSVRSVGVHMRSG